VPAEVAHYRFRAARGCPACRHTGYAGRQAIAEVLRLNDALKRAIVAQAPAVELKALAEASGFVSLRQVALAQVARGQTSLQEVNRVTFVD